MLNVTEKIKIKFASTFNKNLLKAKLSLVQQSINYDLLNLLFLILFLSHQLFQIRRGGTWWDDINLIETTDIILEKYRLFFVDRNNPYLSEFNNANNEFYGYIVILPITIFTNFIYQFIYNTDVSIDLGYYIIRYSIFNIYCVILLRIIYQKLKFFYKDSASFLIIFFFVLTPSVNGHMLFNFKDVPYALHSFLLFLIVLTIKSKTKNSPLRIKIVFYVSIFYSLLLLVRINGILLFVFVWYFSTFYYLGKSDRLVEFIKSSVDFVKIHIFSLLLFFLATPSAWQKPKLYFERIIEVQFSFPDEVFTLTNGVFISSLKMDPTYLVTWYFYKLPIVFHIALIYLIVTYKKAESINVFNTFSASFLIIFFIAFTVIKPAAYDGIRQYLFLMPYFSIVLIIYFQQIKNILTKLMLISTFTAYIIFTQFSLENLKYIYFNEFTPNIESNIEDCTKLKSCNYWFFDYFGYSGRDLVVFSEKDKKDNFYCTPKNIYFPFVENKNKSFLAEDLLSDINIQSFRLISVARESNNDTSCDEIINIDSLNCQVEFLNNINMRDNLIVLGSTYNCNK